MPPNFLILDDAQARSFAQDLGLSITGTLGILIAAYRQGIVADLNLVISRLKAGGFIPGDSRYQQVKDCMPGENKWG
jgi:predicted nucleic acid-binding protein